MLKKREIERDDQGRFDRHGKTLAITQKKTGLIKNPDNQVERDPEGRFLHGGARAGAGRPKGAVNKIQPI